MSVAGYVLSMLYNVLCIMQSGKLETNMRKAIEDYRVDNGAEDYKKDTNNAVANVQQVV